MYLVVFQRYRKIYGFVAWFAEYFGVDVGFGVGCIATAYFGDIGVQVERRITIVTFIFCKCNSEVEMRLTITFNL